MSEIHCLLCKYSYMEFLVHKHFHVVQTLNDSACFHVYKFEIPYIGSTNKKNIFAHFYFCACFFEGKNKHSMKISSFALTKPVTFPGGYNVNTCTTTETWKCFFANWMWITRIRSFYKARAPVRLRLLVTQESTKSLKHCWFYTQRHLNWLNQV